MTIKSLPTTLWSTSPQTGGAFIDPMPGQPAGHQGFNGDHPIRLEWDSVGVPINDQVKWTFPLWSPVNMRVWAGPLTNGDGAPYDYMVLVELQAGVEKIVTLQFPNLEGRDRLYLRGYDFFAPFSYGEGTVEFRGGVTAPPPPPPPPPAPVPTIPSNQDTRELQAKINDGYCVLDRGRRYILTEPLRIGDHGAEIRTGGLPSRGGHPGEPTHGAILVASAFPAIISKKSGSGNPYLSDVLLFGFRIETGPEAPCALEMYNPATSIVQDVSAIGPSGPVILVHGGLQCRFINVDVDGMGFPEFEPRGNFDRRASSGLCFTTGLDENGGPSPFTNHVVRDSYARRCREGITVGPGTMFIENTIPEDCLIGVGVDDTGRLQMSHSYWEACRTALLRMGNLSHVTLTGCELDNTAGAYSIITGGAFLNFVMKGGYLKDDNVGKFGKPSRLFAPGCRPDGVGSGAMLIGVPRTAGMDTGPAQIIGDFNGGAR